MMKTRLILTSVVAAFAASLAGQAMATVIWDGDATKGTGIFKAIGNGNVEGDSTLTAVSDATYGTVWRYHKPSGSNRCESHGCRNGSVNVVFNSGSLYYLGWRNRLSSTVNNNAVFQWKSYGNNMQQNFPLVFKMVNGELRLQYTPPGGNSVYIWARAISANTWYHHVLAINVSTSASTGYVEYWHNGVKQTFSNGSDRYYCRTFDAEKVCPKWGVYGASTTTITDWVHGLKVGTTYADVADSGGGGGGITGYKRLVARHSGRDVVVQSASLDDGANVFQYSYTSSTPRNDEWEIISIGSGYYRVMNRHSGKALVVQSASTADGANVIQWTYGGSNTNDEWSFVDAGGGYYRVVNRHSGKVLDVQGSGTGNSVNIQQNTWNGGNNQQFQLITVP